MNKSDEIAIKVSGVSKSFKLPHEKNTSVKSLALNPFKKRTFEKQEALNDISFEVKKGEFFGIIGRNGSGKSTLLKILAGIYTPSKGHIKINGRLIPFIELGVGFNPELTGRENVYLNGALLGFNRKEMNAMYQEIVDFAEIEKFMDQKLKNYSSGMQVRLAFSIAIRAKGEILLLDEVLAVGDINFQQKCFDYFIKLKKEGRTVVFVSHDFSSVQKFCDRVAIIDQSKLLKIGKAENMVLELGAIMADKRISDMSVKKNETSSGTGDVLIKRVSVKNENNIVARTVDFGKKFTVDVQYTNYLKVATKVVVGISINDLEGRAIYGPNTKADNLTVELLKEGAFQLTFEKPRISPGEYTVTVAVFNDKITLAYVLAECAVRFKINGENRHGQVDPEVKWKFN